MTGITQSTEEGEENSNQSSYRCGEVTEVRSGNNVVQYEYDYKRRLKAVKLNGEENYLTYEYNDKYEDIPGTETKEKVTVTYINKDVGYEVKDKRGNVLTRVYGNESVWYSYDKDGNIKEKNEGGRIYQYTWATGKLTQYRESGSTGTTYEERRTYDGYQALKSETQIINGATRTYDYTYEDNAEHELSSVSTEGWKFKARRDCLGRNTGKEIAVSEAKVAEEIITYRKVGDHATQMPSTIRYGDKTGGRYGIRDSIKYAYDEEGNIAKIYENGSLSVRYTYDKLNRLVREDNRELNKTCLYTYDNNGNILFRKEQSFTLKNREEAEEIASGVTGYVYEGDRLLTYGNENCEYDVLGNPTVYRNRALTWEKGRQLKTIKNGSGTTTTFGYDGEGRRIQKNTIVYTYGSDGKLLKQSDGLEFLYDTTGVAGIKYNNEYYMLRKDILGNIIGILDKNGVVIVKYKYDGWGNHVVLDGNGAKLTAENCTATNKVGILNPFRYRSYYYDTETGLYYLQTRYYDPETGRFITIDDISYLAPDTINGLNLYAYCNNNPVMNVDPEGNKWWHWLAGALAVIGAALVIGAITVLTAGVGTTILAGTFVGAVIHGAAVGALIGAGVGIVAGGIIGGAVSGWSAEGILTGMGIGFGVGAIIGAVIGGMSGAHGWYNAKALEFTHAGSKEVVLGRSPGYVEIAKNRGATYFNTTDEIWNSTKAMKGVGNKGMWKINKAFLKQQIKAGAHFTLANPSSGFFYAKEVAYVMKYGIYAFL